MSHYIKGSCVPRVSRGDKNLTDPEGAGSWAGRQTGARVSALVRAVAIAGLLGLCAMVLPAAASALPTGGISGKVTDTETHAISGANVCLYEENETLIKCKTTGPSGEYEFEALAAAKYRVGFSAGGFAPQYYQGMSSLSEATLVTVMTSVVPNISAEMVESGSGSITGRVTSNGQGVGGIRVCAEGHGESCTETGGGGEYTISGLGVGTYTVSFSPQYNSCEEEQGEKIRCVLNANVIGQYVREIHVKAGQQSVNVALRAGGQISGTVTNASITHPGLAKVEVCATRVTGPEEYGGENCAYTSSNGQYTINGLGTGFYKVEFRGYICSIPKKGKRECSEVYITQFYQGQQTFKNGATITVTVGSNTGGINESLREAFPTTPASTAAPALTGTAAVGQTLSCSQGSWSHEPTYLLYQWTRNGTVITGQTGATYTLQAADQGHSITCSVTAGNGAGAATVNSNTVAIPVPLAVFAGVKVKGSVASVTLRCPGPGACSGVMKIVVRVVTKHGGRKKTSNVTIGVASFSMAAGKKVTLRVSLTGQGRKLLGKAGRRGLKVQVAGSGVSAKAAVLKEVAKRRR
jgi:Carboxypeptidase regulatory-like domain